ncbi:MAG TPA: YqaJ viral recombinase family protein [Aquirhabdus sp.]
MNMLQRSDDWHSDRVGKLTASRISGMNAKPVKGKALNATQLTVLTERITGVQDEFFTSKDMQWGIDNEPNAIAAYESKTDSFVVGTGLVDHPFIEMTGASPDGLVGNDGLIEVKCPKSETHINTLLTKTVPAEYLPQITWQIACTKRLWCDFVSFDPRLPEHLQIVVIRVFEHELDIAGMESDVRTFNKIIDERLAELNQTLSSSIIR